MQKQTISKQQDCLYWVIRGIFTAVALICNYQHASHIIKEWLLYNRGDQKI